MVVRASNENSAGVVVVNEDIVAVQDCWPRWRPESRSRLIQCPISLRAFSSSEAVPSLTRTGRRRWTAPTRERLGECAVVVDGHVTANRGEGAEVSFDQRGVGLERQIRFGAVSRGPKQRGAWIRDDRDGASGFDAGQLEVCQDIISGMSRLPTVTRLSTCPLTSANCPESSAPRRLFRAVEQSEVF